MTFCVEVMVVLLVVWSIALEWSGIGWIQVWTVWHLALWTDVLQCVSLYLVPKGGQRLYLGSGPPPPPPSTWIHCGIIGWL